MTPIDPSIPSPPADLVWRPAIDASVLALVAAVLAAATVWTTLRSTRAAIGPRHAAMLCIVRLGALAALLGVLLGPTWSTPAPHRDRSPRVLTLLDTSLSMRTPDVHLGERTTSRHRAALNTWLDPARLEPLRTIATVDFAAMDSSLRPSPRDELITQPPTGERSAIARAIAAAALQRPTDIVVLSDGADTEGASLAWAAQQAIAADVRVHAVAVGSDERPPDVAIAISAATPLVYEGQRTTMRLRLTQAGYAGSPVTVTLRERTAPGDPGRVVHRERAALPSTGALELDVPVSPTRDPNQNAAVTLVEYEASVEPLSGEADEGNNVRSAFVRVTGERIRVAVFEGEPYWDTKFFVSALRNDPQIDLTSVQALGETLRGMERTPRLRAVRYVPDGGSSRETPVTPPLTAAELAEFDVIVLGRGVGAFFPGDRARMLDDFVSERGGALVFLRGRPMDPAKDAGASQAAAILDALAPVEFAPGLRRGGRVELTGAGTRERPLDFAALGDSQRVVSELPGLLASTRVERERSLSEVWLRDADADQRPAVIAHAPVGRGRTLAVLSEGLWRWAFRPPGDRAYASVYQLFWSRAVRWLAAGGDFLPGQSIALTTDTLSAPPGEPIRVRVRTKYEPPDAGPMRLTHVLPTGERRPVDLGLALGDGALVRTASVVPEQIGVHALELEAPGMSPSRLVTRFACVDDRVELLDTAARPAALARLARATGGEVLELEGGPAALARALDRHALAAGERRRFEPAWDKPWLLAALVALLGVEWFSRRRAGLA